MVLERIKEGEIYSLWQYWRESRRLNMCRNLNCLELKCVAKNFIMIRLTKVVHPKRQLVFWAMRTQLIYTLRKLIWEMETKGCSTVINLFWKLKIIFFFCIWATLRHSQGLLLTMHLKSLLAIWDTGDWTQGLVSVSCKAKDLLFHYLFGPMKNKCKETSELVNFFLNFSNSYQF